MKTNLSSCCNALVRNNSNDDGFVRYVCIKCLKTCDLASPEVIEINNYPRGDMVGDQKAYDLMEEAMKNSTFDDGINDNAVLKMPNLASPELTEINKNSYCPFYTKTEEINKDWEKEFDKEGFTESIDTDNEIKNFIRNLLSTKEKELREGIMKLPITTTYFSRQEELDNLPQREVIDRNDILELINKDK